LIDELKVLKGSIKDGSKYSVFPSTLLSSDNAAFAKHLKSRKTEIETAIKDILKGDEKQPDITEFQERLAKLLASEKNYANELEKLRLEKEQTEERLETASMRYMVAEKKLDRAKSITVAKLEKQALATGASDTGGGGTNDNAKNDPSKATVDSEVLIAAETKLKEAIAVSSKQAEQLEELGKENQKLTVQMTELKLKTSQHTDEDYAHTELFKQAKKQLEDLVNRINGLEAINGELRREAKKLQAERAAYRTEVDAELHASITEKEMHLTKAEGDLARIRAARDELYAELQVRKQAQDQEKASLEQLKQLLAAKEDRISTLESEIQRLSVLKTDISADTSNSSLEELQSKYANIEKQYSMMNQELAAMSVAYKRLLSNVSQKVSNSAEMEEKVARFAAEKSKADQKYFGAMKVKEAREQEVRTLRAQNSKSSEIVAQLKDTEAATRQLVVSLERKIAEHREAYSNLEMKYHTLRGQATVESGRIEGLTKEIEAIKSAVSTADTNSIANSLALKNAELEIEKLKVGIAEKDKHIETLKKTSSGGGDNDAVTEQLRVSL
jgi:E3 ubiquitin-protein ligase BRE1